MKLKIAKIKIEISFTLICIAGICVILGITSGFVWCAAAVLIHELGHLLMMIKLGFLPEKIKISAFEIKIFDSKRQSRSEKQNFFIIFSGPAVNFICFIPFYLLYLLGNENFLPFALANLSVGLFNSLPVLSLDGGQIIFILLKRRLNPARAEKIVDIITLITIFPLAVLGFAVLFKSKYNFSLLFICAYLIISLVTRSDRYI
ncbi:MAG: site-2 protease family protein [Ruminococcus sp.]|uniref:site-2 protease family protein n=1 Tax=Ruminococcus sp. JL13D9 TaxID=3233381 RepID=UPI003899841A|nr:site-2 protease family protein [Ruminococcus sp.]